MYDVFARVSKDVVSPERNGANGSNVEMAIIGLYFECSVRHRGAGSDYQRCELQQF